MVCKTKKRKVKIILCKYFGIVLSNGNILYFVRHLFVFVISRVSLHISYDRQLVDIIINFVILILENHTFVNEQVYQILKSQ